MAPRKIQYAPGDKLALGIRERTRKGGSLGITARTMAQRYQELCRRSLPALRPDEWEMLLGVSDASEDVEQWRHETSIALRRVGWAELVEKLEKFTYAEALAALDHLEYAYRGDERKYRDSKGSE